MKANHYNRFWRWHFYAAFFITPLLITLTLTGIGYLFYTDAENRAYDDLFFGKNNHTEALTIDKGIEKAVEQFRDYSVSKVIVLDEPYNTRLTMTNNDGDQKYVFLDENNEVLFVGGTVVNYLVELAACWAIFLLISGIYMTFRGKILKMKQNLTKQQKNKKRHAFIGTIITIPMIVIIFTGLPWSAFMGNFIYSAAQENPSFGIPLLKQQPPTSDMSEIPWATRKNEAPASNQSHAHHGNMAGMMTHNSNMISVQQLMQEVEKEQISKPYSIVYPKNEEGVFTVSKGSNTGITGLDVSPYEEVTTYFDQYSGKLISKVGYEDYGILAKWFTWGIPLHEGHLFGWPNKLINLVVCLSFLLVIFWGFKSWLSRKKEGSFSAPPKASSSVSISFLVLMVGLGVIMPLFGLSLILVVILEGMMPFMNKGNKRDLTAS
ncbi:PepSY-associated TM helix domain-containing protein [Brevibacillus centrosporus]|uniref:Uncharacterized iron-regulated membrane protein n=1 Tax=Brevibacillus centrosporus TaxID=54910 RepID=A0A1I4CWV9_9BACL|nr:PepSY domain-containing protein [Brevibacillus centrosporus]SFK84839.1 Uncharacterized iron-regulated membrane protein [Brevibacillus centrosporus]